MVKEVMKPICCLLVLFQMRRVGGCVGVCVSADRPFQHR